MFAIKIIEVFKQLLILSTLYTATVDRTQMTQIYTDLCKSVASALSAFHFI